MTGAEHGPSGPVDRQQQILDEATERFGPEAYFLYPEPKTMRPLVMTLANAMRFCGPMITREEDAELWASLQKWQAGAEKLEREKPVMFAKAVAWAEEKLEMLDTRVAGEGSSQPDN